jgi:hypothetical protein
MTAVPRNGRRALTFGCLALTTTTLGAAALTPRSAAACAVAAPEGKSLVTASENALVVWDAVKHREHFIRAATFEGDAKDAGFLVPTPSMPELAAVDEEPFSQLAVQALPPIVRRTQWGVSFAPLCLLTLGRSVKSAADESAVTVLGRTRVGPYDAVTLQGTSAEKIVQWLDGHRFDARPALLAWLAPYVARGFFFTVFRVRAEDGWTKLSAPAVRLSFDTPEPFYPYREPDDVRPEPTRHLRLFFIGQGVPEVRDESRPSTSATLWPVKPTYAGPVASDVKLPIPGWEPSTSWLTVYDDKAPSRKGKGDLALRPTEDTTAITPPSIEVAEPREVPIPADLLALGALLSAVVVVAQRRRHGEEAEEGDEGEEHPPTEDEAATPGETVAEGAEAAAENQGEATKEKEKEPPGS